MKFNLKKFHRDFFLANFHFISFEAYDAAATNPVKPVKRGFIVAFRRKSLAPRLQNTFRTDGKKNPTNCSLAA